MRNRIKEHRKVRAGDLVPHEANPRVHGPEQREALRALFGEIGFARSVLAYELPDGRLKLIDGHLRKEELAPDAVVDVEVLDVNDEEARKLLLSLDPLAQLADYDDYALDALRNITRADSDTLNALWADLRRRDADVRERLDELTRRPAADPELPAQFLVLVECPSEAEQLALLQRLQAEGLNVSAKTV